MATVVLPTWPQLHGDDILAVQDVLESSRLSQLSSSAVSDFEAAFAEFHGSKHCVAVSSGTAAIHSALAALGVGQGDEVIVPSHTFIGSASPILYQRATPVFADVDEKSYCLSSASVEALITSRTKAIVAVHLNGHSASMDAIRAHARRYQIEIIEDVAQAVGGRYRGKRLGTFGRMSCFSFWEDKIITMGGEGGAILTDDDDMAARVRRVRQHGEEMAPDTRLYSSREVGYNYRLTAMQAALGRSQLTRLDEYITARRANAFRLSAGLRDVDAIETPSEGDGCTHAYWKYVCRVRAERLRVPVGSLVSELQAFGIPAYRRYPVPLHRQLVFATTGHGGQQCPTADRLAEELFSLPVHPALSNDHIDYMIARVRDVVKTNVA